jgi:polyisoprenyl-teichoic acid--peptidoglycan teichoic acid transferase
MKNLLRNKHLHTKTIITHSKQPKRFPILIGIGGIILLLLIIGKIFSHSPIIPNTKIEPTPIPSPTPDPLAPKNILILGYAGGNHDGSLLTDTMIIAHIRPKDKQVILISIPRDLWVNIPVVSGSDHFQKINAAYAYGLDDKQFTEKPDRYQGTNGGGNLAMDVVSSISGLPIQNYVAINFQGFQKAVDILGGVNINVPVTFDDFLYPIEEKKSDTCGKSEEDIKAITATMSGTMLDEQFPCRYEHIHFDKGITTMNGETALKFVRSRKSETDGGDFSRSRRQQALLFGIKDKFLRIGSIPKIIPLVQTASAYTTTDMNISTLFEFLNNKEDIIDSSISTILLTEDNILMTSRSSEGLFILTPKTGDQDWNSVHEYINSEIQKIVSPEAPTIKSTQ